MKAFRDYSIFQGWKQFMADDGSEIRAEDKGGGYWSIYISDGQAFIHSGVVYGGNKPTSRKLWAAYENWV